MNILAKIVRDKKVELSRTKKIKPLKSVQSAAERVPNPPSFAKAVVQRGKLSIIAEMKCKSPSAGTLIKDYHPGKLARLYKRSGASAISVLTEQKYFGGDLSHVREAASSSGLPVLRKDFVVDPYQIFESKAAGASCVLLIAGILTLPELKVLLHLAEKIGLDALVETHSASEIAKTLKAGPSLVGINNRDLKTLTTDVETTFHLLGKVAGKAAVISESGIDSAETVRRLKGAGVSAALIGESILRSKNPGAKLKQLVNAGK